MMKTLNAVMLREWRQILCGGVWKYLAGCAGAVWFGVFLLTLGQFSHVGSPGFQATGRLFLWWIGVILFCFDAGSRSRKECGAPALDPLLTAPVSPWTLVGGKFLAVLAVLLLYTALTVPALFLPEGSSPAFAVETLVTLLECMLLLCGIGAALAPGAFGKGGGGTAALLSLGLFFIGNALLLGNNFSRPGFQRDAGYVAILLGAALLLILCTAAGSRTPVTQDRWGAVKLLLLLYGLFLPGAVPEEVLNLPALTEIFRGISPFCGVLLLLLAAVERLTPARRTLTAAGKHRLLYALYPLWGGSAMTFLLAALIYGKLGAEEGADWFVRHGNLALVFFYPALTAFLRCFTQEKAWKILLVVCGCAGVTGLIGFFGDLPLLLRFTDVFSCDREYGWFYAVIAGLDAVLLLLLIVFPWQKARCRG